MKQFLIFLLTTIFLYACNRTETVQTNNPTYPNGTSYPNAPSYPNDTVTSNNPGANEPAPKPYAPQPGDSQLSRGNVFIDSSELLILESYPVQIMLVLKGNLPTPCNQLRVATNPPDKQNQIYVEVYSVILPDQMCAQVLEPFEANVGLGSFSAGHYSIWVNGEMIGEFDS